MNRRMRRELYCILSIVFAGLVPSLGGLVLAGYLSTRGWPDGCTVPLGMAAMVAGLVVGFLIYNFVADSPSVKAWIEEPKKEKAQRPPRYGAWHDESDEYSYRSRD